MRKTSSMRAAWVLLALLALTGCGQEQDAAGPGEPAATGGGPAGLHAGGSATWPSTEERRLAPDHHPTPYSAQQIRRACPDGRVSTFRMTIGGNEGVLREWRFTAPDAEGVTITTVALDEEGDPTDHVSSSRRAWAELQRHASYPAEATTVSEERVTVPAGTWDCMLYTVEETRDGKQHVSRYWFAWDLPGPPVKMEQRQGGAVRASMEMIAHEIRG